MTLLKSRRGRLPRQQPRLAIDFDETAVPATNEVWNPARLFDKG